MCRKFHLIANIDSISTDEVVAYVRRLFRVYIIFSIISGVELGLSLSSDSRSTAARLSLGGFILYLINTAGIGYISHYPHSGSVLCGIFSSSVLCIYDLISGLYQGIVSKNVFVVFSVISICLQACTIYILYKLREKFLSEQLLNKNGEKRDIEASSVATAYPVSP